MGDAKTKSGDKPKVDSLKRESFILGKHTSGTFDFLYYDCRGAIYCARTNVSKNIFLCDI